MTLPEATRELEILRTNLLEEVGGVESSSTVALKLAIEALASKRKPSPIKAFVEECCEVRPGATVECNALYLAWCRWTAEQGREHPGTKQIFGRNLSAAFPELRVVQPRINGSRERHYEGLRLK